MFSQVETSNSRYQLQAERWGTLCIVNAFRWFDSAHLKNMASAPTLDAVTADPAQFL